MKPNNFAVLATSVLLIMWFAGMSPLEIEPKVIGVPEDYPGIQQAIDAAAAGDTIEIAAGTYFENLVIAKPLRLIGEGPNKTVIAKTGTVVLVKTSNVEIRGVSVQNGTYGIFLWYSSGISLRNNDMSNNRWNFGVWGDALSHFVHDIDSSNTVDGKPIYFWVNQHGKQVPDDAGYVALINSTDIIAKNMDLTSNEQGILLVFTKNSVIENVTISGNDVGIHLHMSHNNTIRKNRLLSTIMRAIYLESSHNNTFYENTLLNNILGLSVQSSDGNILYHNNFIHNSDQVYREVSQNIWHNEAHEGNYWSDYIGQDNNGDGIGDTNLPWQDIDWYPLMDPWRPEIYVDPPLVTANPGEYFTINIGIKDVVDLFSYEVKLSFDSDILEAVNIEEGPFLKEGTTSPSGTYFTYQKHRTYILVDCVTLGRYPGVSGSGTLFTAIFIAKDSGNSTLSLYDTILLDSNATKILHRTSDGTVIESPPLSSWWFLVVGFGAGAIILIIVGFWRYRSSRKQKVHS